MIHELIAFPLDATDYTAMALGGWHGSYTRGVFSGDEAFLTKPAGGMNVQVAEGLAVVILQKYWPVRIISPACTLRLETAHSTLRRIDAVCVRLDKNANTPELLIKTGTPAANPVPPPIIQGTLDYDEIYPFTIEVPPGATSITAGMIHDTRANEVLCGFVSDGIQRVPVQALYNQAKTKIDEITAFQYEQKSYRDETRQYAVKTEKAAVETAEMLEEFKASPILLADPTTGAYNPLQTVVFNMHSLLSVDALTAEEYEALGVSAEEYASLGLTARQYDSTAKQYM